MQPSLRNLGPSTNRTKTLQILLATASGMAALLALLPAAGHDQLWFLLMGQRWLGGAILYGPTLFDSNPPLIVWLSAIPVLLGEHLHLPIPAIGKSLVLLAEAASATLSFAFLRRLHPGLSRLQLTWLAFAFVIIFAVVPARDLGQRDHLTAILCLPYVLAAALYPAPNPGSPSSPAASSPESRVPASFAGGVQRVGYRSAGATTRTQLLLLRSAAGALAAIGICLKPHQALIPIAVELTRLVLYKPPPTLTRNPLRDSPLASLLRPEPPILVASALAFLAAIHYFAPLYFTLALPTLRDTYWAIGHLTPFQLLAESLQLHLLAIITLTLFFLVRRTPQPELRGATTLLLAAALAATAAFYLQGTGWYYQQLPAISLFACALALELFNLPSRLPDRPWLSRATLALSLLALALTTHFTGYPFTPDRAFAITSPDPTFFTHLPPDTPVALITTSVDDSMMPVARYHLLWAQRTNNVWLLPAILRSEDPQGHTPRHIIPSARLAALDAQQHAWMVEDLNRWRPELMQPEEPTTPGPSPTPLEDRHDNLLAWFQHDPAFRAVWQHYRYLRTSGDYDAYTRNN